MMLLLIAGQLSYHSPHFTTYLRSNFLQLVTYVHICNIIQLTLNVLLSILQVDLVMQIVCELL